MRPDPAGAFRRVVRARVLRTASFRLTLIYLLVFTISAGVLGMVVFAAARSALLEQTDHRIEGESAFLAGEYATEGREGVVTAIRSRGRGAGAFDYLLQDASGMSLAGEIPAQPGLTPGWASFVVPEDRNLDGQPEVVRALVTELGGGLSLVVGDEHWRVEELQEAIAEALTVTIGIAVLLGLAGGILVSRAFLVRIDGIARTAQAIIGGDLTRRIPVRGTGDDVDRLAATLNTMLDRIATLLESLRQVGSDVAHDLRTPLTRLLQQLEQARLHATEVDQFRTAVDRAVQEAEGLLATFAALLRIAQVEGASPRAGFRRIGLAELLETVVDAYRPDAEAGGRVLDSRIDADAGIEGDRELLMQAVANLVENALTHTPPGTRIVVALRVRGTRAVVSVADDGPGVAAADLPHLADRFYRAERSRTAPGNGLGLTLVAAVADLHGARLVLEDAAPGLRAAFTLDAAGSVSHGHVPTAPAPSPRGHPAWRPRGNPGGPGTHAQQPRP